MSPLGLGFVAAAAAYTYGACRGWDQQRSVTFAILLGITMLFCAMAVVFHDSTTRAMAARTTKD